MGITLIPTVSLEHFTERFSSGFALTGLCMSSESWSSVTMPIFKVFALPEMDDWRQSTARINVFFNLVRA